MLHIRAGFSGSRDIVLPPFVVDQYADDPLLSALHITDIGHYPLAAHHYVCRPKGIPQYVFIYCVEGAGSYEVGGKEYQVHENQFFILPANKPHSYASNDHHPWTIYWIHFGGVLARHYADKILEPQDLLPEIDSRISTRTHIFEEIFQTLHRGFDIQHLHYASCLFHYYLGTLRYVQQFRDAASMENVEGNVCVQHAIHFMTENLEHRLTLLQIAQYVGMSPSHFSHLFQRNMGVGPIAYYNSLKIEQACVLLRDTDMKINQISYKLGFEDAYYFSRMFAREKGMSPRQWRNQ